MPCNKKYWSLYLKEIMHQSKYYKDLVMKKFQEKNICLPLYIYVYMLVYSFNLHRVFETHLKIVVAVFLIKIHLTF